MSDAIIPIFINNEPPKCPECKNTENIKRVCIHCGHEYITKDITMKESILFVLITLLIILVLIDLIWIILTWLDPVSGNPTLLEVIQNQIFWVSNLRMW